jgi:chemotaxis protein histidine kinase CheA
MMDLSAFLGEFQAETGEHLRRLDGLLLALERDPSEIGPVREMFLSAHTIKGGASMLGLEDVRLLGHALEDVLACLRDRGQPLDRPTADLLFRAVDGLRERVSAAALPGSELDGAGMELVEALRARAADEPEAGPPPRALVVEDSATVRLLETMLLRDAGFEVDSAADGSDGLRLALTGEYRLVVAGHETRGLRGPELLVALRGEPATAELLVVLTSAELAAHEPARAGHPGREFHVPKGALADHRLTDIARAVLAGTRRGARKTRTA